MKPLEKVIIIAAVVAGIAAIVLVLTFTISSAGIKAERTLEPYRAPGEAEGLVTYVSGGVFVYRGAQWKKAEIGELVRADDYVKTFENSYCDIQIGQRAVFTVLENTSVRLALVFHSAQGAKSETELLFGGVFCKVKKLAGDESVRVRSGAKAFGVRGTEFLIERRGGVVVCAVKDGRVAVAPAAGGAVETTVAAGRELSIDESTGAARAAAPVSDSRRAKLDRLAEVDFVDADPARETELVKVGIEVEPDTAEILANGRQAGIGSYAGLFTPGIPIPVVLRKSGYKAETFTITPKRGDNRIYAFRLELDAPEKPVSAPGPDEAAALEIKRLQDEAKKAAADNEALRADVESLKKDVQTLQKEKADLNKKLDDANRKIKDALQKLQ
ncbi:MAG: FecR domain-containing protein [Spirochaetales bacterium]|nr:FecR domain-containing protein [Spirochaetales bacterium]